MNESRAAATGTFVLPPAAAATTTAAAGADYIDEDAADNLTSVLTRFKKIYPVDEWKKVGFFREDYLRKIDAHWLRFEPPSPTNHYVLAVLYIVIMLVGVLGNALVIILFIRRKSLRTPANTLVINLAISDLMMMLKMPIFIYNSFHLGPALGEIACRAYGFIGGLTGTVSICTLSLISLDRYYVIKFPLNRRFTNLRAKVCLITAWLYGLTFSIIPLLNIGLGSYVPEGYLTSCSFDYLTQKANVQIFILVFFAAAWIIPFTLITFCYINIVSVVIKSKNLAKKDKNSTFAKESVKHIKEEDKRRQEVRLAGVVLLVISLWFAAWTPYAIVALLGVFNIKIPPIYSMIPALFCKTASCIDPFVYALTHPKFKSELRALFYGNKARKNATVWSVASHRFSRRTSKKTSMDSIYDNEEEDDENDKEEVLMVNLNETTTRVPQRIPSRKSSSSTRSQIRPAENELMCKKKKKKALKKSWWYRPSFSNRSSSIRSLARNWTTKKRQSQDEEEDIPPSDNISC